MNDDIYLERDMEKTFCDWVKKLGGLTYKWEGCRKKIDRIVVTHTGDICLIEFKLPDRSLSAHQWDLIDDVKKISNRIRICTSVGQAKDFYLEVCEK